MKLKQFFYTSRPRFWLYTAGPFAIGYISIIQNFSDILFTEFLLYFLFFLIPSNYFIYSVNDYFDEDTDMLNAKKNNYELKLDQSQKKYIILINALIFALGLTLSILSPQPTITLLMILFFFFSYFYSAPPIRFKKIPFLDSFSNVLYTIPAIIGIFLVNPVLPAWYILLILILWPAGMHLFSAIPDIEADKQGNINTTAVFLGYKKSLLLCFIYWGIISALFLFYNIYFLFIISLIYPLMVVYSYKQHKKNIFIIYTYFPWINTGVGFVLFWYFVLG